MTNAYGYAERDTEQALRSLREHIVRRVREQLDSVYRLLVAYKRSLRKDRVREAKQSDYILALLDEIQKIILAIEYLEKQVNE